MSYVSGEFLTWLEDGRPLALATLVDRSGSSPLEPGAMMLIDENGDVDGSVTGGCVESSLVDEARAIFTGAAPKLLSYGISNELGGEVGLSCGGAVHIFLQALEGEDRTVLAEALRGVVAGSPVAIATVLDGPSTGSKVAVFEQGQIGSIKGQTLLQHSVESDARGLIDMGTSLVRRYATDGALMGADVRVHFQTHASRPRMVIFGAIDLSAALARLAGEVGYEATICDARAPFARSSRFSEAAEVVVSWPDSYLEGRSYGSRDAILVMTHDAKFDGPALIGALETSAGFIGALGSRVTQADRFRRLRDLGVEEHELDRISAPCGLDIGARTPAETAVSILAEIISLRAGRSGGRLVAGETSIHGDLRVGMVA